MSGYDNLCQVRLGDDMLVQVRTC